MTNAEITSGAFDLYRSSEVIVVAKRREYVVDGIVTGIIVNALALPVLLVMLLAGLWLLVHTVTQEPSLLPGLMAIMFVGVSILLLRLFLKAEYSFFPYECRFKKPMDVARGNRDHRGLGCVVAPCALPSQIGVSHVSCLLYRNARNADRLANPSGGGESENEWFFTYNSDPCSILGWSVARNRNAWSSAHSLPRLACLVI